MEETKETFYVTTAINYTNGKPHIGHAYEAILADIIARFNRIDDKDVFFCTGTDEHGAKIAEAAKNEGVEPIEVCNKYVKLFQNLNEKLNISNDYYIRTTEEKHLEFCKWIFQKALDNDDIYLSEYEGWYNIKEEAFITENEAKKTDYKDPATGKEFTKMKEESYFFRQSKYQDTLIKHIEDNEGFISPEASKNQILERLKKEKLEDLSVSRTTFDWGVPLPNDPKHVMYVWFDALSNYLSAIDYPEGKNSKYWPSNCQIIGKDITWFHTVIWPCMLLSTGIPLPEKVLVHGFINDSAGKKMSKSVGNVVDPHETIEKFGSDSTRYFLTRCSSVGTDIPFGEESLAEIHNSDLADCFGNLVQRVLSLTQKYCDGKVPQIDPSEVFDDSQDAKVFNVEELISEYTEAFKNYDLRKGIEIAIEQTKATNKYLTEKQPWKVKDENIRSAIIKVTLEAIYVVTILLSPVIVDATQSVFKALHTEPITLNKLSQNNLVPGTEIDVFGKSEVLFKKIIIVVEPIQKIGTFVAQILEAKNHPNADSLYLLSLDAGEKRQVVAGLKKKYTIEELVGKKVVLFANLKPAKIRGEVSQGMILTTVSEDGNAVLLDPNQDSPVGSVVQFSGKPQKLRGPVTKKDFEPLFTNFQVKDKTVTFEGATWECNGKPIIADNVDDSKVK